MNIYFYNCNDPNIKINKSIAQTATHTGVLRDESSIIDPVVTVNASSISGNYAYIPQFGRYYFIKNITSVRNGLWKISMHVDVLMTYSGHIKNNTGIVARQANAYNDYLPDDKLPIINDDTTQTLTFAQHEFGNQYFVAVIGNGFSK